MKKMKRNELTRKNRAAIEDAPVPLGRTKKIKRAYLTMASSLAMAFVLAHPAFAAAGDPLAAINNLSDFVFSAIKAIGAILLGFGIVQIGLALKGHDASQRAQGFMTFFGGVVIYFAKDILDMIV